MKNDKQRVPDEIQKWAIQNAAVKVRKILGCSSDVAMRLHKGIPVFMHPFEIEWMTCQYRRMRKLYRDQAVPLAISVDRRCRIRHKDIIRMMAEFTAKNIGQIRKFNNGGGENHSVYRWQSMYKPLYDFGTMLNNEVLPYLKYVWHEYPESRHDLFDGTGFEEFIMHKKKQTKPSS